MRYYVIAGEPSGDMHGADLMLQIKVSDPNANFWFAGGSAMTSIVQRPPHIHCSKMAYMGFDFFKAFYSLYKMLKFCKQSMLCYDPDIVILIDYSGFNMKLAHFAKKHGYKVYYYIPPKIWAHGHHRIKKIKKNVDHIGSILPFEVAYYQKSGYEAITYVGNPLVEKVTNHVVNPFFREKNNLHAKPIIALLPGSRLDEIQRILPDIMVQGHPFDAYQFVVAGLNHIPRTWYTNILAPTVQIVYDQTYDLLKFAEAAIVASGTASLEAALFDVPQLIVYKTNPLAYIFYKTTLKVNHISLVNLLLGDKTIVPELIQHRLTKKNCSEYLKNILNPQNIFAQKLAYQEIRALLGPKNAAEQVVKTIGLLTSA